MTGSRVEFSGNYSRVLTNLRRLSGFGPYLKERLPWDTAKYYEELLYERWPLADSEYEPLSPRWLEYKRTHDLDRRIWYATHTLISHVQIVPTSDGIGVTVDPSVKHPLSGLPLPAVAAQNEYGNVTRNIPPRPLWRDTKQDLLEVWSMWIKERVVVYWKEYLNR